MRRLRHLQLQVVVQVGDWLLQDLTKPAVPGRRALATRARAGRATREVREVNPFRPQS